MDENVKHKFRQCISPKKYARKKGKVPYKSENIPNTDKNDKKNDTKVFVLTPDMLKKLGLNLNTEQSIEKAESFSRHDTDVNNENLANNRLLTNDLLNKNTSLTDLDNNIESNNISNIILPNNSNSTNSQIENFDFDPNVPEESDLLRIKDVDSNTSISSDFIMPDMLPPPATYELFTIPYDAANSNENANSSIDYSENITSNNRQENTNYDDECTFLNEVQNDENNLHVQSAFDSFEHLNNDENDEPTRIIPNTYDSADKISKSMRKKNVNNDFTEKITTLFDKQDKIIKGSYNFDSKTNYRFSNNVKTYQSKSPKFSSSKHDPKMSNNQIPNENQTIQTDIHVEENLVENNEKSVNVAHVEDNKKNMDEIVSYLRKFLNKNRGNVEHTNKKDSDKSEELPHVEENVNTSSVNLNSITGHKTDDMNNQSSQDCNETQSHVDIIPIENNNLNENIHESSNVSSTENCNTKNCSDILKDSEYSTNENILIDNPVNTTCESSLHDTDTTKELDSPNDHVIVTKEVLSESSSNGFENLTADDVSELHDEREKEVTVLDINESDHTEIIDPDKTLENSYDSTQKPKPAFIPVRRGRKKKNFSIDSNFNESENSETINLEKTLENSHDISQELNQTVIPKKRGKKKKNIDFNESENSKTINLENTVDDSHHISQESNQASISKKRGRKDRSIDYNESKNTETINFENTVEDSHDISQESNQASISNKRGRKNKKIDYNESENPETINPENIVENSYDTSRKSDQATKPKKKRREKKNIEPEKMNESSNDKEFNENVEMSQISQESDSIIENQPDVTLDCSTETSSNSPINTVSKILEISDKGKKTYIWNGKVRTTKGLKRPITYYKNAFSNFNLPKLMCKCAVCGNEMLLRDFPAHSLDAHNLLAWTEGEKAIDLSDVRLVKRLLSIKLKVNKKLTCKNCGLSRSSADGFISHIMSCEKSEDEISKLMVECSICHKSMLPISLKVHMTSHKPNKLNGGLVTEEVEGNLGNNRKRKAATQALESFKKLKTENEINESLLWIKTSKNYYSRPMTNRVHPMLKRTWKLQKEKGLPMKCNRCDYSDLSRTKIEKHFMKKCPVLQKASVDYQCLNCDKACRYEDDIIKHVWDDHKNILPERKIIEEPDNEIYAISSEESTESLDEEYVSEPETETGKPNYSSNHIYTDKSLNKESIMEILFSFTLDATKRDSAFHQKYAEKFVSNNFSTVALCKDIHYNDILPLSNTEAEKFLPEIKHSCSIAHTLYKGREKTSEWKKFKLFESEIFKESATMWCGGQVWALGWVPGERENKYLAVAADFDGKIKNAHNIYSHNNIIQFWNAGKLDNNSAGCQLLPEMVFAITHDYGVVWDMDWCPSGCSDDCYVDVGQYERESNSFIKMGLLAIACSNGKSYIYAIPHPSFLPESETKLYNIKPSIELHFNNRNSNECDRFISQACKIKWSPNKGHKIIIVGYSNGFVALFDLTTQSALLKIDLSDSSLLLPFEKFQPYTEPITGLTFVPQCEDDVDEENLVIGVSSSMGYSMWLNSKLIFKQKGRFTDITNLNPWPQVIAIPEEISHPNLGKSSITCSRVVAGTLAGCNESTIATAHMFQGGGAIDSSLWNNKLVIGGANGIIGIYPQKTPFIRMHQVKKKFIEGIIVGFSKEVLVDTTSVHQNSSKNDPTDENNPISQVDKSESYGLVFVDIPKKSNYHKMIKEWNVKFDKLTRPPLTKLNCIKTHPSSTSHYFNACGGSAGQVRILFTNFIDNLKR